MESSCTTVMDNDYLTSLLVILLTNLLNNHCPWLYIVFSHKFQFSSKKWHQFCSIFFSLQQCSDSALSNKTEFPTFARTMQPSNRIAKSIVSVLNHFQWNRVVSLVGEQFMSIYNDFEVILQNFYLHGIFHRNFSFLGTGSQT